MLACGKHTHRQAAQRREAEYKRSGHLVFQMCAFFL